MIIKTIKNIYFKYIAKPEKSWTYFLKQISHSKNSLVLLKDWEEKSCINFDSLKYAQLLQISFLKDKHDLAHYLLDNKNFVYPFIEIPCIHKMSKIHGIDSIMTNGLLRQDHAAWLALLSCHHPFHLLQLEKKYDLNKYHHISRKFFLHPDFKYLYMDKKRRDNIISHCPTNATSMLLSLFLEMDLDMPHTKNKIKKI